MILRIACLLICFVLFRAQPLMADSLSRELQDITVERYRQALAVDPDNATLRYYLGVTLLAQEQFTEAARELKQAWPAYAQSVEANYNLALALAGTGDIDSALIYLQQAEDLGATEYPDTYPVAAIYFNLALELLNRDQPGQAANLLEHALQLPGPKTEIHRLLGDIYQRLGETERSEQHWLKVLEAIPGDPDARDYLYTLRYNRALELLESEPEQAREYFLAALEINPGSMLPHYYLAYLAYQNQECSATLDHLLKAGDKLPDSTRDSLAAMAFNCAARLLEQNQPEAAKPAVALLAATPGSEVQAHFLAGNIHLALKDYAQARREYLKVLEKDPGHAGANLNLLKADQGTSDQLFEQGRNLFRRGAYGQAVAKLEECLRINPAYPMARDYLDQSRLELKQKLDGIISQAEQLLNESPRQALVHIDQGLEMDPGNIRLKSLRERAAKALAGHISQLMETAKALIDSGADRRAEERLNQILQIAPDHAQAKEELERLHRRRQQHLEKLVKTGDQALDQGDLKTALAAYNDALAIDGAFEPARAGREKANGLIDSLISEHLREARRARQAGQLAQAADAYRRALALRPQPEIRRELETLQQTSRERIETLQQRIEKALKRSDLQTAAHLLKQLERLTPETEIARNLRSRVQTRTREHIHLLLASAAEHLQQMRYKAALTDFRRVLELEPDNKRAQKGLNRVRNILSDRLKALLVQTDAALGQGQYGRARALLQEARSLDAYNAEVDQKEARLAQLEKSGLKPEDAPRLYLQGIDLYTRGQYRQAIDIWKQVLELDPKHERARSNISKAERKLAQIERISQ